MAGDHANSFINGDYHYDTGKILIRINSKPI
jgi:hypothetical protein